MGGWGTGHAAKGYQPWLRCPAAAQLLHCGADSPRDIFPLLLLHTLAAVWRCWCHAVTLTASPHAAVCSHCAPSCERRTYKGYEEVLVPATQTAGLNPGEHLVKARLRAVCSACYLVVPAVYCACYLVVPATCRSWKGGAEEGPPQGRGLPAGCWSSWLRAGVRPVPSPPHCPPHGTVLQPCHHPVPLPRCYPPGHLARSRRCRSGHSWRLGATKRSTASSHASTRQPSPPTKTCWSARPQVCVFGGIYGWCGVCAGGGWSARPQARACVCGGGEGAQTSSEHMLVCAPRPAGGGVGVVWGDVGAYKMGTRSGRNGKKHAECQLP